jgi:predicted metal-dependent phosphoesterase TrpH
MSDPVFYKIDLHVHAAERSGCANGYEETMIRTAIAEGLHGLAFTDHHAMPGAARLDELNHKFQPFKVYAGIEITAEQEDWLVLGLRDPELARHSGWTYAGLHAFVREKGGFLVLAHPFRYSDHLKVHLNGNKPDGMEYRSNNTPVTREADIRGLAAQMGSLPLCNSDAHSPRLLGKYFNLVTDLPQNDLALVDLLRCLKGS